MKNLIKPNMNFKIKTDRNADGTPKDLPTVYEINQMNHEVSQRNVINATFKKYGDTWKMFEFERFFGELVQQSR